MSETLARAGGRALPEAEIVENERVEVAGVRGRLRVTEVREWTRRTLPVVAARLAGAGVRPAGAPVAVLRPCEDGSFEVTAGYPVERLPMGTRLDRDALPGGQAVRALHSGSWDSLLTTYDRLFEWLVGHGRSPGPLMWEQYVVGPQAGEASDTWRTIVSCPLAP